MSNFMLLMTVVIMLLVFVVVVVDGDDDDDNDYDYGDEDGEGEDGDDDDVDDNKKNDYADGDNYQYDDLVICFVDTPFLCIQFGSSFQVLLLSRKFIKWPSMDWAKLLSWMFPTINLPWHHHCCMWKTRYRYWMYLGIR